MRLTPLLIGFLTACSAAATDVEERVALGTIAGYTSVDPQIEIGATTGAVTVRVTTYGNSCYRIERTDVAVQGRTAVVTPWDRIDLGGACADILRAMPHMVSIPFAPGPVEIVVRGLDRSAGPMGDTISVRRSIVVP